MLIVYLVEGGEEIRGAKMKRGQAVQPVLELISVSTTILFGLELSAFISLDFVKYGLFARIFILPRIRITLGYSLWSEPVFFRPGCLHLGFEIEYIAHPKNDQYYESDQEARMGFLLF